MFSQLGPLFKTMFRQAEQSDARLEIRREEKENQKKKENEKEDEINDVDLWQDSTNVSIIALRNFLVDFLKSKGDNTPDEKILTTDALPPPTHATPSIENTNAMRAHKAYAVMSSYAQTSALPVQNADAKTSINLSDLLAVDELRTMHVLITELDRLHQKGVQTLTIEKQF
jgi:hypothetical protein